MEIFFKFSDIVYNTQSCPPLIMSGSKFLVKSSNDVALEALFFSSLHVLPLLLAKKFDKYPDCEEYYCIYIIFQYFIEFYNLRYLKDIKKK